MTSELPPEQSAKEDYLNKLMSFRKDELIIPDESDEEDDDLALFNCGELNCD